MASRLLFIAFQPKSSNDYQPHVVCTDDTYDWRDSTGYGDGFDTEEEAVEDFWNEHDKDDYAEDFKPEIYTIGSEYDGAMEDSINEIKDSDEFAALCIEEAQDAIDEPVFFEYCPRGFANEVGFVAVPAAVADQYREDDKYEEIDEDELRKRMEYGAECHAENNSANNPPCGSYGIEILHHDRVTQEYVG